MPGDRAEITYVREVSELDSYREDWDRFARQKQRFFPCYDDARSELEASGFVVAIDSERGSTKAIACFINRQAEQPFTVGERRLFSLPAREIAVYGGDVLGAFRGEALSTCLRRVFDGRRSDLLTLGEVEVGTDLHKAGRRLPVGMVRTRRQRKDPVHWVIPLPATFEEYLLSLRASTRKSIRYAIRRFERETAFSHEVVTSREQVSQFLRDGEIISRQTYQWHVGERLVNDDTTRQRYTRLADQGRLRCHLLYMNGEPCAFARGVISGHVYHYETPGFRNEYRKYSPGLFLLMRTIEDLIANTQCQIFDFGLGGDEQGYKARFGTRSVLCEDLQWAPVWRPYSALLILLYAGLSMAKNVANTVIGTSAARLRIKKAIRRYR